MSARWVQYGHEWCQEMQNCQENLKIKSKYYISKIHINGIIEKLWKYHHSLQSTVRTLKKPSLGTIFSEILTRFPRAPRPWDIPRIMSYPTHLTYPVDLVSASCAVDPFPSGSASPGVNGAGALGHRRCCGRRNIPSSLAVGGGIDAGVAATHILVTVVCTSYDIAVGMR